MGALRQRFFKEPDLALQREIEEGWRRLSSRVSKDDQKRILGLVDLQTALLDESTLASFAAGFQVASWRHQAEPADQQGHPETLPRLTRKWAAG